VGRGWNNTIGNTEGRGCLLYSGGPGAGIIGDPGCLLCGGTGCEKIVVELDGCWGLGGLFLWKH